MSIFFNRIYVKIFGVLHLHTEKPIRGDVLLSYIPYAFLRPENSQESHTNYWECREMARIFLDLGYNVDVIDWKNDSFLPKKKYSYFIDIHSNMERLSPFLPKDCIKIFHATGAHWLFQNHAEYSRLLQLQKRRHATLMPRRVMPPSLAMENADVVVMLGNEFTEKTYNYSGKKIHHIPLSATHTFPFSEEKNIESAKKNFVWFGGAGMVHKGLDLVLEAFAEMPEYQLSVCGPIRSEKDFEKEYWKELYETKNITAFGKIDAGGDVFRKIAESSVALIYPSCSEGGGGSVIHCMHAGLIPIISFESSVNVGQFGILLKENTVEEIQRTVRLIAVETSEKIKVHSKQAWEYARANHSREEFSKEYLLFVQKLESEKNNA
jgi:glycosyltransferase involved in cell wall biosynthesis